MDAFDSSPLADSELIFDRGTLVLSGALRAETPPSSKIWKWREETSQWHTDAFRYQALRGQPGIIDRVPTWSPLLLAPHLQTLREYQNKAKDEWSVRKTGLIVLPTGTGKTAVGLTIMAELAVSSLVVCPTRDLMYQWANRIEECLGQRPGIIGDNRYEVRDICVTTYHSACIRMAELGSRFGLIVFDECHHLPGRVRADAARMSAAPYRLGLTATPPVQAQLATIHELIGPVVYAEQMLALYHGGTGQMLGELRRKVDRIFDHEEGCHPRRIKAFMKILEDASDFETANEVEKAWKLRLKVFAMAGERHPLVKVKEELHEHAAEAVKTEIAEKLARSWSEIEANLYADVLDFHVLKKFRGPINPKELLSEYNVAQAQVALFNATAMKVTATQDYRRVLAAAKLFELVVKIERVADDKYCFTFSGAASDLRTTPRYGTLMAKVLRTVLRTKGWNMEADILLRYNRHIRYCLNASAGLGSHLPPFDEHDSGIESTFFAKWGGKVRQGWSLSRESRVLHKDQTAFFPDFLLTHEDGREILFEIIGHWTPEYLRHKLETLRRFGNDQFLLAVKEGNVSIFAGLGIPIIPYKNGIILDDVLTALGTSR
jgi:uncharacterized protein